MTFREVNEINGNDQVEVLLTESQKDKLYHL